MFQAFVVVLREGLEGFLLVAIVLSYLRKTLQLHLIHAVYWGILGSVVASAGLGYLLWRNEGANEPIWEGSFALVTAVLVVSLVIHMWRIGPQLKKQMENQLAEVTSKSTQAASFWGVFIFTLLMITREGMETVLLLIQIRDPHLLSGMLLGLGAAVVIAYLWQQFGYLINLRHFFQVTAVFLMLFAIQIFVHAIHEFSEANLLPYSEVIDVATDSFSAYGYYGKKFSLFTMIICGGWLLGSWVWEKFSKKVKQAAG